ncbi:UDP-N-acetylglucosamine--LPS N-acetylglucosamine transferase [Planctomycetales bacterium ZRK34]|nr:UDP-N-acetylglucosamine--LPS N-acetylglucosamine transferase [Planctomycetales bacterium ZRK34]
MTPQPTNSNTRPKTLMLVASGGGHWVELIRLRPAFEGHRQVYVTTTTGYESDVEGHAYHVVPDANRWNKLRLMWLVVRLLFLLLRVRPDVIVSTGAAPGYLAMRMGKWFGARAVWVDSIANVEELSLSGQMAGKCADLWLTQWEHLTTPQGPHCQGAVL